MGYGQKIKAASFVTSLALLLLLEMAFGRAAGADWKAEWDVVLAAAKKEGKVVVAGGAGPGYRKAVDEFQKAYPDIKLEYTGGSAGNVHAPKILAERQAGLYLWDVFQGAGTVMLEPLIPQRVFAPLRPPAPHRARRP